MANPQNFVTEANKLNIKYEYLVEAVECIGKQSVSRLFNGNSNRGKQESLSAATIDNWLLTRSVYCPTCRHDIRETTPRTQEASVPSTQQDASSILNMQDLLRVLSSYR